MIMSKKSPVTRSTPIKNADPVPFVVTHKILTIVILALSIFVFSGLLWWKNIYNNPRRVFETMIVNNLQTQSYSKSSSQDTNGNKSEKVEQISFVPDIAARSVETVTQSGPADKSTVKTEIIGTLKDDYVRYVSIQTNEKNKDGKPLDYSSVENVWGKTDSKEQPPQYLSQSILNLVPFANLNSENRSKALSTFYDKKAYEVDYSKVKPLKINGKSALVYPVKINASGYINVLKVIASSSGLGNLPSLDPESYKDQPPIEIEIVVDKLSRRVIQVKPGQNIVENYSSYGLSIPIQIPKDFKPASELQKKIQEIK
jgi:hypothetical protein